nr:hypothetical protein [Tanacetum cinerariifolium]
MDKGVVDTVKDHKRKYDDDDEEDDDEDPLAGPNQGKKTKRRRTKESSLQKSHSPPRKPQKVTYTTSITKIKAARYKIKGIEDMVSTLWSTIKHAYDKDA